MLKRLTARATASAVALAVAAGPAAAPALAHTLSKRAATTAAKAQAQKAKKQTRARGAKVIGCNRQTDHQFYCRLELRYRSGASRCTADVTVRFASASSSRVISRTSNYRCF